MYSKLFSIVVPTKNRQEYLKALIKIFHGYSRNDVELVIEDNSDDNSIESYIKATEDSRIVYSYDGRHLSVVENSDRAIEHSSGEYVCFMGDDDFLSEKVCEFVDFMKKEKIHSAIFEAAKYYWPGTEFVAHKFPSLVIKKFKKKVEYINVAEELDKLLKTGATSLKRMPKVYHGIVMREKLDKVKEITGTYFPGPSPDMANSVALSLIVEKHIYCDVPFVSSGASPKSTAGLGTKHEHEGKLSEVSFLPSDVEETWCKYVPKVWTGPTIYAQSAILSLEKMGRLDLIERFNFNYSYAYFEMFCPRYKAFFNDFRNNSDKYNYVSMSKARICIFFFRMQVYLKNVLLTKFKYGGILKTDVNDSIEAEKIIDSVISKVIIDELIQRK